MHIPSGASQTVEILDFETALALSGRGDAYDRTRWLYVPDSYTEYRYILGTRGENPLICIGVNPSTAEPTIWTIPSNPSSASLPATALTASSCSTSTPSAPPGQTTWTAR